MNTTTVAPTAKPQNAAFEQAVRTACKRIAPLWPLQNFVAVNPFLGLSEMPFVDACELIRKVAPGGMQMSLNFYREKFESGEIKSEDLEAALSHAGKTFPEAWQSTLEKLDNAALESALAQPEADSG